MNALVKRLQAAHAGEVRVNAPMAGFAHWRIGGPADLLILPRDEAGLVAAVRAARDEDAPVTIMGAGSNLLFDDAGVRGVVVSLTRMTGEIAVQGLALRVQAGASMAHVAKTAARAGLSGLEHAANIPGTLGGLIAMNGGSERRTIGEVVTSTRALAPEGEIVELGPEECGFGYRQSAFQRNGFVILGAALRFAPGDPAAIFARIREDLAAREKKFPLDLPSCGSVFKSHPELYERLGPPGKILEDAGLKGLRLGDMEISPKHANFFVNHGNGRSADALALIAHARRAVHELTGVWLECEARYVPPQGAVMAAHEAL